MSGALFLGRSARGDISNRNGSNLELNSSLLLCIKMCFLIHLYKVVDAENAKEFPTPSEKSQGAYNPCKSNLRQPRELFNGI